MCSLELRACVSLISVRISDCGYHACPHPPPGPVPIPMNSSFDQNCAADLRRVHEQLCSLHTAGSVVAAAGLSWAGLMEDMAQQVSAVGAALALSESRHAMAIEEAARRGADLTHLRHELRETTDRAAAASKRNAEAQSIAAVVHQDELNKAVAAERNRSETQLAEVVAQYGGKVVRPLRLHDKSQFAN